MKYITRTALLAILVLAPVSSGLRAQGRAAPDTPEAGGVRGRRSNACRLPRSLRGPLSARAEAAHREGRVVHECGISLSEHRDVRGPLDARHRNLPLQARDGAQRVVRPRNSGKMMTCTQDPSVKEVSFTDTPGIADSAKNVKQPSLAELMHRNKGQVVTMSIKPRSAIGLAGHRADSVIWFDEHGTWETSTAYGRTLPAWVMAFAKANPVDRDAGKVWERTLPADRYQYDRRRAGRSAGRRLENDVSASPRQRRRSRLLRALADVTVRQRVPRADGGGGHRHAASWDSNRRPISSA